jgi:hypothetical protein
MAVSGDGALLVPQPEGLCAMPTGDAARPGRYLGPALTYAGKALTFTPDAAVAVSADGQWAYVSGLAYGKPRDKKPGRIPAVFRLKLPGRSAPELFFGNPEKPGTEKGLLSYPYGLAVDGRGHLLVADRDAGRIVVVSEKTREPVGSAKMEKPLQVAVNRHTGEVYVLHSTGRKTVKLAKYRDWKTAEPLASAPFQVGSSTARPLMALDAEAKPAVVWFATYYSLLRIEDRGESLGEPRRIGKGKTGPYLRLGFEDVVVDRYRPDQEVYARLAGGSWLRFNEATGKTDFFRPKKGVAGGAAGMCLVPGPDGNVYALGWPSNLFKLSHEGDPLKWESPNQKSPGWLAHDAKRFRRDGTSSYVKVCMVYMTHTMGVRPDGRIFVFEAQGNKTRGAKRLLEFEPSGKLVGPSTIWKVSDAVLGPKFDQQGNIYIADQVKPPDQVVPPEYSEFVGEIKMSSRWSRGNPRGNPPQMYGSIIKFPPRGGMIDCPRWNTPYAGKPRLDPSLKSTAAVVCQGNGERYITPAKIVGAEWVHMGINHVELHYCNCENTRFDVDAFGRVWYPDLGRYRVGVLDTAGNEITHFGGYGNADDTPMRDGEFGMRNGGAQSSRIAHPASGIAFSWLIGVAATDRHAYMGDGLNRRLLRARLVYAAEATAAIE